MDEEIEMSDRPDWDDQFAETEDERNARLRTKRQLKYDKERRTIVSRDSGWARHDPRTELLP